MKLTELYEIENEPAWYVVREGDDAIAAGPYDSEKEARLDMRYKVWYNVHGTLDLHDLHAEPSALKQTKKTDQTYYIEYGIIDPEGNHFDTFKPMPRPRGQ